MLIVTFTAEFYHCWGTHTVNTYINIYIHTYIHTYIHVTSFANEQTVMAMVGGERDGISLC